MRGNRLPLTDAVVAAVQAAFLELGGAAAPPVTLPLDLSLIVYPGSPWRVEADPALETQIRRAVREAVARQAAYQPGKVWCYRCESAGCEHAFPPAPDRVFGGYGATGLPRWPELAEALLELRHPGVARLFNPRGRELVAAQLAPQQLKDRQLDVFGRESKTYDILGQVVFGPVQIHSPGDERTEADLVAFTLQAVETRSSGGRPRLDLNVIARLRDGSPALEAFGTPAGLRILNIISAAKRRIHHLAPRGRPDRRRTPAPPPPGTAESVAGILRDTVRALERLGRQATRRTLHAEERARERRPTAKAREDALAAGIGSVLRDERRGTLVVIGPHHRVHVFSPEGRHITSLALDPETVRRRRRRERWEPLDPEAVLAFRKALAEEPGDLC